MVRGNCDYSDSHKSKIWQGYAAIAAAAYTKELLSYIPVSKVLSARPATGICTGILQGFEMIVHAIKEASEKETVRQMSKKEHRAYRSLRTFAYEESKNLNQDRVVGTCKWVLDHDKFRSWSNSHKNDLLWISADPGCGKSVLSRSLIEHEFKSSESVVSLYFSSKTTLYRTVWRPDYVICYISCLPSDLILFLMQWPGTAMTPATKSLKHISFGHYF